MRQLLFAAAIAALPSAVSAQQQTIVDACVRAAEIVFSASPITAANVQSFPELTPPRVQMRALGAPGSMGRTEDLIARETGQPAWRPDLGAVRCLFSNPAAPFGLTAFECITLNCHVSSQRLEEIQALLEREGL